MYGIGWPGSYDPSDTGMFVTSIFGGMLGLLFSVFSVVLYHRYPIHIFTPEGIWGLIITIGIASIIPIALTIFAIIRINDVTYAIWWWLLYEDVAKTYPKRWRLVKYNDKIYNIYIPLKIFLTLISPFYIAVIKIRKIIDSVKKDSGIRDTTISIIKTWLITTLIVYLPCILLFFERHSIFQT